MKPPLPPDSAGVLFVSSYRFDALRFDEVRYPSELWSPTHTHEEAYLVLCLEGTMEAFCNRQSAALGPATLNFLPRHTPHACQFQKGVRNFQMVLKGAWLERVQQVFPPADAPTSYLNGLPTWIATRIYREYLHRDNLSPLVLEGMLLELLAEMSRHATRLPENDCPRWLRQARDYLHAHFTENLSLEALAAAVGVHSSHLMRCFRQYHRCTIGDYVRRLRVEYACHLLSTSDASPSCVAFAVGFSDQSHFNRTFKGYTGMTPLEFQKVSGRASLSQKVIV